MQELTIPDPPPGLGRAATKTAEKAATAKRASLENMVKMRVGWVCVSAELRDKDEVGYSN